MCDPELTCLERLPTPSAMAPCVHRTLWAQGLKRTLPAWGQGANTGGHLQQQLADIKGSSSWRMRRGIRSGNLLEGGGYDPQQALT